MAVAAALLCTSARAEEQSGDLGAALAQEAVEVGAGVICNTSEQVRRYVDLRADGTDPDRAVHAVNDEVHDPRACGAAVIAFTPDKKMEIKSAQGKLMSIVRITVVAAFNSGNWSAVPGMVQYTIMETDGYEI
jgi:hypothetical protein